MKKKVSKTFPDNIFRFRGQLKSRERFLRLDKNEKTSKIHNSIHNTSSSTADSSNNPKSDHKKVLDK